MKRFVVYVSFVIVFISILAACRKNDEYALIYGRWETVHVNGYKYTVNTEGFSDTIRYNYDIDKADDEWYQRFEIKNGGTLVMEAMGDAAGVPLPLPVPYRMEDDKLCLVLFKIKGADHVRIISVDEQIMKCELHFIDKNKNQVVSETDVVLDYRRL